MSRWLDATISEDVFLSTVLPTIVRGCMDGDAAAMLQLDFVMRQRGWLLDISARSVGVKEPPKDVKWGARYSSRENPDGVFALADTEPDARALAAYQALTGRQLSDRAMHTLLLKHGRSDSEPVGRHMHVHGGSNDDTCILCGFDLRDPIHIRAEEHGVETDD